VSWIKERPNVEYNHDTGGGQEPSIKAESMLKLERVEEISLAIGIHQEEFRPMRRGLPWVNAYLGADFDQRALTAEAGEPSSVELE